MQGQEGQQTAASTPPAQYSDAPMSEHQQQVIQDQSGQGQAQGQQQAQGEGKSDLLREASVVGADIQADNGVIHVIDAVLLPQEVLKMLEAAKQG